jgi:hypothetical protein
VLEHDDVAIAGAEFGMELSAPASGSEALSLVCPDLRWVDMVPSFIVALSPAVMRHDDDLDTCRSDRRNQFTHVIVEAHRFRCLLGALVEFATFAHEIVIGVDDQEGGAVCGVCGGCHGLPPNRGQRETVHRVYTG